MEIKRTTLDKIINYTKFLAIGLIIAGALIVTSSFWLPLIQHDPYLGSDKAAVTGAEAYFSVNVEKGYEAWLKGVCDVSTKAGCDLTKTLAESSGMWKQVEAQKTTRQVKAQAVAIVDKAKDSTTAAVWKIKVMENFTDKQSELFVAVAKEGDTWKFDRLLLKQEAERYTQIEGNK